METTVWSHKYIIPKCYLCTIQNHVSMIGIKILTNLNIISKVTPEWGIDGKLFPGFPEYIFHCRMPFFLMGWQYLIVAESLILTFQQFFPNLRVIICVIQLSLRSFLFFCHLFFCLHGFTSTILLSSRDIFVNDCIRKSSFSPCLIISFSSLRFCSYSPESAPDSRFSLKSSPYS